MTAPRPIRAAALVAVVAAATLVAPLTAPAGATPAGPAGPAAAPAVPAARLPQLAVDDASAYRTGAHGSGVLKFQIRLLRPASTAVSVHYATQDGTATAGRDYTAVSGNATIPVGSTAPVVVSVRLLQATAPARQQLAMSLNLSRVSGARLEKATAGGYVLADGDDYPRPIVGDAAAYRRPLVSNTMTFPVRLGDNRSGPASFTCTTRDATAQTAYRDYTAVDRTVTVPAGAQQVGVDVTIPAHTNRTASNFTLTCGDPTNSSINTGTGSILPGVQPDISLSFMDPFVVSGGSPATAYLPVYLLGAPLTVPIQITGRTDGWRSGTWSAVIAAGATSTTVPVGVSDSSCVDEDTPCNWRFLFVTVGGDRWTRLATTQSSGHPTLVHDPAVAANWVYQPFDASVEVGDTFPTQVTLRTPNTPNPNARFTYTTEDGTAVAGRDYVAQSGTFAAGGPAPTFRILPGSRPPGVLTFTVRVTPVAPATLAPGHDGLVTVRIDPIDTFRPTGTVRETSGRALPAGLQVFFDTSPGQQTHVPVDANGNFALAGMPPTVATGRLEVPAGWTGDQTFRIPTAAGPGHVTLTITAPT